MFDRSTFFDEKDVHKYFKKKKPIQ